MAFIQQGTTVYSFAEYQDVVDRDQRLFEANEGLTQDVIEDLLIRSTQRILSLIRATDWWESYYVTRDNNGTVINTRADIPALDAALILNRRPDFTDLCVYYGMYTYILPKIADFGEDSNAEVEKMGYYNQKYDRLFSELIRAGDWYDFNNSGTVTSSEKQPGVRNLRRVR